MKMYAAVHILDNPFSIDSAYHYYVPPMMAEAVVRGAFVTVPFGRGNRKQLGVVVALCDPSELPPKLSPDKIKPVGGVCRERLCLSDIQLGLCHYLQKTTLCTIGEAVRTVVPAAALATLVEYYHPLPESDAEDHRRASLSPADLLVLDYIRTRHGGISGQTVKTRFGAKAHTSLDRLCERGLIARELTVKEPTPPSVRFYTLTRPAEEIEAICRGERGFVRVQSEKQRQILKALLSREGRMSEGEIKAETDAGAQHFKALSDKGLLLVETEQVYLSAAHTLPAGTATPFAYSEDQEAALATLTALAATGEPRAALLHGITGSGKTCVILSMIDHMLAAGKGSIVLLPEISLTPQMFRIFEARYGHKVAIIHSGLSAGERWDSYRRILAGDAPVVVGTRSAVFSPMPNLGLIVMDEEQEHTYKSDQDPKYHARDIARFRCASENALMLLSSATPSLESYQKALEGKYTLIPLKKRYGSATLPEVLIADMRGEAQDGNTAPLGAALLREMTRVKSEDNQAVLFLNRRGYSHQLVCRSCGQAVTCSRCSVALNFHRKRDGAGELVCHWCGSRSAPPSVCPQCASPHLFRMGYGTQRIEEDLGTLMPDTRVLRMDADTTGTKSAYHDLLDAFRRHDADVLLGTQMVTKGHDFPDVTLVGVLMADMSLYLDDFRAGERTFSMITQVIGRAGRADKPGLAVIQTMNPDHEVLRLACAQDYETFFAREIRLRRLLQFPPFCDIVLLNLTCPAEQELQRACLRLSEEVERLCTSPAYEDIPLLSFGPFESPVYRVDNIYRMRMIIKCRLNNHSRAMFAELLSTFSTDTARAHRPILSIDFNPSGI